MRRKWELNVQDPTRWYADFGKDPNRYFIRQSNFTLNYLAYFIENFEETYERKARIIEYGAGCTSMWWAKNFPENEYIGVEGSTWWMDKVNEELAKLPPHKARLIYHPADESYTTIMDEDLSYYKTIQEVGGQFDLIINDGCQREMVGDFVLRNANDFISLGGLYLRHDYEMAILGNWVGLRDPNVELPQWCRDKMDLGYEGFVASHPEYACVTVTGNHIATKVIEMGGVWRKSDFMWTQKLNGQKKLEQK